MEHDACHDKGRQGWRMAHEHVHPTRQVLQPTTDIPSWATQLNPKKDMHTPGFVCRQALLVFNRHSPVVMKIGGIGPPCLKQTKPARLHPTVTCTDGTHCIVKCVHTEHHATHCGCCQCILARCTCAPTFLPTTIAAAAAATDCEQERTAANSRHGLLQPYSLRPLPLLRRALKQLPL